MNRNGQFSGKTVFVSGAAQGIGLATARRFAEEGAALVMVDLNAEIAGRADELAAQFGVEAVGLAVDVRSAEQIRHAAAEAHQRFGGVDVVVNVAGIFPKVRFEDTSEEIESQVLDVNVLGVTRICRAMLPMMRGRAGASIVNIASGAAFLPLDGYSAYSASKAAVVALSRCLALELAPDIRVNVVAPGATETESVLASFAKHGEGVAKYFLDMTPLRVLARSEDIADGIVFLASNRAGHITGATLPINGGSLMH